MDTEVGGREELLAARRRVLSALQQQQQLQNLRWAVPLRGSEWRFHEKAMFSRWCLHIGISFGT